MPNDRDIASLRRRLLERRRRLVESHRNTNRDIEQLQDAPKDPEFEESAQLALAEYTLERLTDSQRREAIQIDAALGRMDAGEYGVCEDCGGEISLERLRALPFATRCTDCAQEIEKEQGRGVAYVPGTM